MALLYSFDLNLLHQIDTDPEDNICLFLVFFFHFPKSTISFFIYSFLNFSFFPTNNFVNWLIMKIIGAIKFENNTEQECYPASWGLPVCPATK